MKTYMEKLGLLVGASCVMLLALVLVSSLGWLPPSALTYEFGGEPAPLDDGPTTIVVESEMVADEPAKYDEEATCGTPFVPGIVVESEMVADEPAKYDEEATCGTPFVPGDGEEARQAWQEQLRAEVSQPFAADYPAEYIDWLLATSGQDDLDMWDLGPERIEYWNSLQSGHKELIAKTVIAREDSRLHPHLWRLRVMLYKDQSLVKRVLYLEEAITEQEVRMAELQQGDPAEVEGGDDLWTESEREQPAGLEDVPEPLLGPSGEIPE